MRSAHCYCSSAPDEQLRCSQVAQLRGLHCCGSGASATPQVAAWVKQTAGPPDPHLPIPTPDPTQGEIEGECIADDLASLKYVCKGSESLQMRCYSDTSCKTEIPCNKLFDKLFAQDGADDPGVTVKSDWDGTLTMDWSTVQTVSAHGITEETQVKLVKVEGCPAVGTGAPW
jgi:hypothetical protein